MINKLDADKLAEYFNIELRKNQNLSVNKLCDKIGIKKSTLKSKLTKAGYNYDANIRQYTKQIEVIIEEPKVAILEDSTTNITSNMAIDTEKVKLFFDNIDYYLNMLPKENLTAGNIRSNINKNATFKVDTGIYKAIKERATRDNITIAEIINRAVEEYLEKYI